MDVIACFIFLTKNPIREIINNDSDGFGGKLSQAVF